MSFCTYFSSPKNHLKFPRNIFIFHLYLRLFIFPTKTKHNLINLAPFCVCLEVWWRLFFKLFFYWKYINMIFFIFQNLFLISVHQNDSKNTKKIYFKVKKILKTWSNYISYIYFRSAYEVLKLKLQNI